MTLQIPDDLAKGLENIAAIQHKSVEQLALESLRSVCEPPGSPQAFLRLLREMRPVTAADAAALEASVAAGRLPVRDHGLFDKNPGE
jgi:hypothetical protein